MTQSTYLAFDFGAESGRAISGTIADERLCLEEIHRFPNRQVSAAGRLYWDILYLFDELKKALSLAAKNGLTGVRSIGVDTWGVDFGLIDRAGQLIGNPVAYRDPRTNGMMEKAFRKMSRKEIYRHTGIQFMQLNTVFQLLSMVEENNPQLTIADRLLFMPDLFAYLLTGTKIAEYTIASTSQLLDTEQRTWSDSVFSALGLPRHLMPEISKPGAIAGPLLEQIARETGMPRVQVTAPAGHDTACAVAAVPARGGNWAYLSSGTWSLLGIESDEPIVNDRSFKYGFTNEGGVDGKIRFLKNIMGMWLFERCRQSWMQNGFDADYDTLIGNAGQAKPFRCIIDPDHASFLNPPDMPEAISALCKTTGQPVPENQGQFVRCIFESLAFKYRYVVDCINDLRPNTIDVLHVVGGGSQNKLLNQYIANAVGIPVIAGPKEGTAIGNILLQAISAGDVASLAEARAIVRNSFDLERFEPEDQAVWNAQYKHIAEMVYGK